VTKTTQGYLPTSQVFEEYLAFGQKGVSYVNLATTFLLAEEMGATTAAEKSPRSSRQTRQVQHKKDCDQNPKT
jgi:hypothetical protein